MDRDTCTGEFLPFRGGIEEERGWDKVARVQANGTDKCVVWWHEPKQPDNVPRIVPTDVLLYEHFGGQC